VVRANVVGQNAVREGTLGYGDSAIFDPNGAAIAEAGLFRERLIVAEVEPQAALRSGAARRDELPERVRRQLANALLQYERCDPTRAPTGEDRGGAGKGVGCRVR